MEGPTVALSLNEAEALAAKAARGAGLSWGEAEDLGRAARWLAASGLDWADPLLGLVNNPAERDSLTGLFRAADRAFGSEAFRAVVEYCRPSWALAVLAAVARGETGLDLGGSGFRFRLSPGGCASAENLAADIGSAAPTEILVETSPESGSLPHRLARVTRRTTIPAASMRELGAFAARTYVPASAESRRLGAGGGRIDDP